MPPESSAVSSQDSAARTAAAAETGSPVAAEQHAGRPLGSHHTGVDPSLAVHTGLQPEPLLSEMSRPGAPGHRLPVLDVPEVADLTGSLCRGDLTIPEIGELDVIRHFTHLSQRNYS